MPRLIPTISVGVSRKVGTRSQTIYPAIGEMFDFTDEEIKQIRAEHPEGLRKPINETDDKSAKASAEVTSEEENGDDEEAAPAKRAAGHKPAGRKPGVRRVSGDDDEEL